MFTGLLFSGFLFNSYVDKVRWMVENCPFLSTFRAKSRKVVKKGQNQVCIVIECPLSWKVNNEAGLLLFPLKAFLSLYALNEMHHYDRTGL